MPGFTMVDNPILEAMLTTDFTKRQLKLLALILRFSNGFQKSYAVLRQEDYAYARLPRACVNQELEKLEQRRVIKRVPDKDLVWINPNPREWDAGRKAGPSEPTRLFFKLATKNSMRQQLAVGRDSDRRFAQAPGLKGKSKSLGRDREEYFREVLKDYFLKVAPLDQAEVFLLRQVVAEFSQLAIASAIERAAERDERCFSSFLKALDECEVRVRRGQAANLGSRMKRLLRKLQRS